MDEGAVRHLVDALLPERLQRLRRVSGLPVVFGGSIRQVSGEDQLVISRLIGTWGTGLRDLAVPRGRGLGGAALREGLPRHVDDYASAITITHDFDRVVVDQERLVGVLAVPVLVRGVVRGVLYAALRDQQLIGDRSKHSAIVVATQLQRDVEGLLWPEPAPEPSSTTRLSALADLADLIRTVPDAALRERLIRIHQDLGGRSNVQLTTGAVLTPRELDVIRLVAVGASNLEIAAQLGVRPETVKAYLRSAMRKLDVHNRTAAVHAIRRAGML
jgi:LuxR family transcriptional regulator, regulator of acetate metabolism